MSTATLTPDVAARPLRLGIVGCGRVATTWHLPALAERSDIAVAALADIDAGRAADLAARFGIGASFGDPSELVADSEIDAVAVCVPVGEHAAVACAALDAGKHVFVEKPLALTLEDCDRVAAAARDAGRVVTVGFNMRWHRLVRRARRALDAAALGRPLLLQSMFTAATRRHGGVAEWRKRPELGGGVLLDQAVHHLDLWRHLLRSELVEVHARATEGDESAVVCARSESGVLIDGSFSDAAAPANEIALTGSDARMALSLYRVDGFELVDDGELPGSPRARLRRGAKLLRQSRELLAAARQGGDHWRSYGEQWGGFAGAVRGWPSFGATVVDGRRAVELQLAVRQSAVSGAPVTLASIREGASSSGAEGAEQPMPEGAGRQP